MKWQAVTLGLVTIGMITVAKAAPCHDSYAGPSVPCRSIYLLPPPYILPWASSRPRQIIHKPATPQTRAYVNVNTNTQPYIPQRVTQPYIASASGDTRSSSFLFVSSSASSATSYWYEPRSSSASSARPVAWYYRVSSASSDWNQNPYPPYANISSIGRLSSYPLYRSSDAGYWSSRYGYPPSSYDDQRSSSYFGYRSSSDYQYPSSSYFGRRSSYAFSFGYQRSSYGGYRSSYDDGARSSSYFGRRSSYAFSFGYQRSSAGQRSSRTGLCQNKTLLNQLIPQENMTCGEPGWTFPGLIWGDCPITVCILKTPQGGFGGPTDF